MGFAVKGIVDPATVFYFVFAVYLVDGIVPAFKVKLGAHKGNLALQVTEPVVRTR